MSQNDFDDATTDGLKADVPVAKEAKKLRESVHTLEFDRLEQAQGFRLVFFWAALGFAAISVVASVWLVWATHLWGTQLPHEVAVAFFAGVTVEVIGLMAIIATYLFPKDKGSLDPAAFN